MEWMRRSLDEWYEVEGFGMVPWMVWTSEKHPPALSHNVDFLRRYLVFHVQQAAQHGEAALVSAAFNFIASRLQAGESHGMRAWLAQANRAPMRPGFRYAYFDEQAGLEAGRQAGRILWRLLGHRHQDSETFLTQADELVAGAAKQLGMVVPKDGTARLLIEALARGIPLRRVSSSMPLYRLGQGRSQKRIWRGFTSNTSHIGTIASTHKSVANELLRAIGLPVPVQRHCMDMISAKRAAMEIGFPVVVKPASTDYGTAVSADVRNEADLYFAFRSARRHGMVLVEEQLPGADYRLVVVAGRCVSAIRRDPARIFGDGVSDVETLVSRLGVARRADPDLAAYAAPSIDEPLVREMLRRQGVTGESIPSAGQTILLRTNANVSTGGTFADVNDDLHPDNARLAERAAACLGLDHAGIDLITPDIRQPWHRIRCGICEINPTPGMDAIEIKSLLDYLFPAGSNGRIPVVVVVGEAGPAAHLVQLAEQRARATGRIPGTVLSGVACIDGVPACIDTRSPTDLLDVLLADAGVGFAVAQATAGELLEHGLRLSHCDLVVFLNGQLEQQTVAASTHSTLGRARTTLVNPTLATLRNALLAL